MMTLLQKVRDEITIVRVQLRMLDNQARQIDALLAPELEYESWSAALAAKGGVGK